MTKKVRVLSIDLRKLGARLPDGVKRTVARTAAAPLVVGEAIAYPEGLLEPLADRAANPIATGRVKRCTIATRAQIVGIADLPAIGYENARHLPLTLFRVRVERPGGEAETCVRQHFPREIRRLAPGSSVRALAHETEPRFVVLDWKTTGERIGVQLSWTATLDQYAWPGPDEWPAVDAIEVRDGARRTRRLRERQASWSTVTARLAGARPTGAWVDNREEWKLVLDLGARQVGVTERVPDLALAKLTGVREGPSKLGGMVTTVETVANVGAPLIALVSPAGDAAVDWEATLNQPELRATT